MTAVLLSRQQQLKANGGDWVGRAWETCLCFATGQSKRKRRGREEVVVERERHKTILGTAQDGTGREREIDMASWTRACVCA